TRIAATEPSSALRRRGSSTPTWLMEIPFISERRSFASRFALALVPPLTLRVERSSRAGLKGKTLPSPWLLFLLAVREKSNSKKRDKVVHLLVCRPSLKRSFTPLLLCTDRPHASSFELWKEKM